LFNSWSSYFGGGFGSWWQRIGDGLGSLLYQRSQLPPAPALSQSQVMEIASGFSSFLSRSVPVLPTCGEWTLQLGLVAVLIGLMAFCKDSLRVCGLPLFHFCLAD
jgi:hypothetical protein